MLEAVTHTKFCTIDECDRPSLAKGMCNAHYSRYTRGYTKDKDEPIRKQVKGRTCSKEGCNKKHYGNGLCVTHWRRWNRNNIKSKLIKMLGGKCVHCEGVFPMAAFDFHHIDPKQKDFTITNEIANKPFKELENEVKKCILLCANCHRVVHSGGKYAE